LKEHFIVVQWDQRETNKTLEMNSSPVSLKVSLFENDTKDLIDLLLKQFKQKKLYLVAHSWGSALGFYIADKYPQLLYAYVAISPMINQLESERMTLKMLKQKAEELGNTQEIRELSLVQIPFENGKKLFYARKWLFKFNGQPIADKDTSAMIKYIANWSSTWLQVWNEALNKNLIKDIPKLNCPIYFFIGRNDYQTHFTLAEEYYNSLVATKKRLFWFEKSGHLIPNTEPALLQNIIIKQVLPETFSVL
jgi:pimeloyl-ACP methyl ester carboxylesterase